MNLAEKRAERAKLVSQMREINDAAEEAKRSFTADETEKYSKLEADVDKLGDEIRAEDERLARAAKLKALDDETRAGESKPKPAAKPVPAADPETRTDPRATEEYRDIFEAYLRGGMPAAKMAAAERADTLQVGLFAKGGALVGPEQFVADLISGVDDAVFVRQYATKHKIASAASLGVPTLDADIDDAEWTAELATGNQGDITVGKRELRPHPLAKRVKISKTLSRLAAIPIASLVLERLQYKFGVTEEQGFLTGSGSQQPLGIFVASDNGVPTSQDVSTDNTATELTADGLIEAKHGMKAAHWRMARWLWGRVGLKKIRKLKDGEGQYLWQPGLAGGLGDRILDLPYDVSEYCPSTFTADQYVGALCNWSYYWIVDALDMTVQYLDQLYAESNQDGYIGRAELDGMPVLAEAFIRVKLAS